MTPCAHYQPPVDDEPLDPIERLILRAIVPGIVKEIRRELLAEAANATAHANDLDGLIERSTGTSDTSGPRAAHASPRRQLQRRQR